MGIYETPKEIEELKDEFYDWWFEQFKQKAYMPSIFEWFILKLKQQESKSTDKHP